MKTRRTRKRLQRDGPTSDTPAPAPTNGQTRKAVMVTLSGEAFKISAAWKRSSCSYPPLEIDSANRKMFY